MNKGCVILIKKFTDVLSAQITDTDISKYKYISSAKLVPKQNFHKLTAVDIRANNIWHK